MNSTSTRHRDDQQKDKTAAVCRIGGVVVPFASGRWVWLSKSRTSLFPYGEQENAVIEQAFAKYSAGFKPIEEDQPSTRRFRNASIVLTGSS